MMKKFIFGMAVLSAMQFTHAATDWTPQLTSLQDSCGNAFHVMNELPKKYQASIIRKGEKQVKDRSGGNNITTTYYLKDSTFFGLPLEALKEDTHDTNFEYKKFSMVFKDTAFMKLRPSFYYVARSETGAYTITADNPKNGTYRDEGIEVTYKNTALGYEVEIDSNEGMSCSTYLNFDKANKTLSCDMACG